MSLGMFFFMSFVGVIVFTIAIDMIGEGLISVYI